MLQLPRPQACSPYIDNTSKQVQYQRASHPLILLSIMPCVVGNRHRDLIVMIEAEKPQQLQRTVRCDVLRRTIPVYRYLPRRVDRIAIVRAAMFWEVV